MLVLFSIFLTTTATADGVRHAVLLQPAASADQVTAELIETRRKEAAESSDLNDEAKKKAEDHYRLAAVILSFNAISVGWSKVQWLATALTFGLAFGLQEIFANFVAGLILLFERPIRIGDVVTVDDVSGVVSRIRIRATTITNWDRKEYVIPNKEFITGRMLNWTLSDKTNRVVINVGIAYGSDVDRAKQLLLKVCTDHPLTMTDPATVVTFEGFGDNSLNFVVRTYLPDLDNRLAVIDALHTNIDRAFRDAGIEIAFPQRDLHLRGHLGI